MLRNIYFTVNAYRNIIANKIGGSMKSIKAFIIVLVILSFTTINIVEQVKASSTSKKSSLKKSKKHKSNITNFDYKRLWITLKYGQNINTFPSKFPNDLRLNSEWGSAYGLSVDMRLLDKLYGGLGVYYKSLNAELYKAFPYYGEGKDNLNMNYLNIQMISKFKFIKFMWIGSGPSAFIYLDKNKRELYVSDRFNNQSVSIDLAKKEKSFIFGWDFGLGFIIPLFFDVSLSADAIYTYALTPFVDMGDDKSHIFSTWSFYVGATYLLDLDMFF